MTTIANEPPELTEFFCCAERHFAQFHEPPPRRKGGIVSREADELTLVGGAAGLIYSFLLRLSKHGRKIWVTIPKVAGHLKINLRTAERAFGHLKKSGFFVLLESGKANGEASLYQILLHSEWAALHPNQCSEKFDPGWQQQEDPLGVHLYTASAGKVKFAAFQIAYYRQLQASFKPPLSDQVLVERFNLWFSEYSRNKGKQWRKSVGRKFKEHLEALLCEYPNLADTITQNGNLESPLPFGFSRTPEKAICR
jgi:hypothetical protein